MTHERGCFRIFMRYILYVLLILLVGLPSVTWANTQDEIQKRNQQIEEIERQIEIYQQEALTQTSKAETLASEITKLNAQIGQIQLEIKSLGLSIDQTNDDIISTQHNISDAENTISIHQQALSHELQTLYQNDQQTLTEVLIKNEHLSDFFNNLKNLHDTQSSLASAIATIKDLKNNLQDREAQLKSKRSELEELKQLQSNQKTNLDTTKKTKNQILQQTKGEEARYQQLVQKSRKDIEQIRAQIFYLQQSGISVEDAIKYGKLAALRVDIRPAFLIAILEVETGLGRNVGTGTWLKDMYECYIKLKKPNRAEQEKAALFSITAGLGLNPDGVKVSREPAYGCGGALGPAQFLPSTWLAYAEEVAKLTGRSPANPWNIEDAFIAAAIKLARGGAAQKNIQGEKQAAKAYISGNGNCTASICNYYANSVANKAAIIEQNL